MRERFVIRTAAQGITTGMLEVPHGALGIMPAREVLGQLCCRRRRMGLITWLQAPADLAMPLRTLPRWHSSYNTSR